MKDFILDKKLYIAGGTIALVATSYVASVALYLWLRLDPDLARPWTAWYFLNDAYFQKSALYSLAVPHALLLGFIIFLCWEWKPTYISGARWASWMDLKKAHLLQKGGLLLGKFRGQYLLNDDPTHVMVIAPTRSGKGVGLVVPNLLLWEDSFICLDIKQENYKKTAGFRKSLNHGVFMWAPVSPDMRSHCYNPLDAVSKNPHKKISDVQAIAKILIPDPNYGDDFWASEARSLFVGLVLYVLDSPKLPSTIGSVYRMLGAEADLGDICRQIVQSHPELPSGGQKTLMSFANKVEKERSGVKSSLDKALHLWTEPAIDAVTSKSDFSLSDLRKRRMAIYVGVPTGEIGRVAPLLRIFFDQVINTLSMKEPDETEPRKVLILLDEFHMLGEMTSMTTAFTLLGGFGCRVMAVVQGLKWLDVVYGKDKRDGILSSCAHQVFFAANDLETASYISQSCGDQTVKSVSVSRKKSFKYEAPNETTGQTNRPLISKSEARMIPGNKQVMIVEKSRPALVKKIVYYKDKNFTDRLLPPPKVPLLEIKDHKIPQFNTKKKAAPKAEDSEDDAQRVLPLKDAPKDKPNLNDIMEKGQKPSSRKPKQPGPGDSTGRDREAKE